MGYGMMQYIIIIILKVWLIRYWIVEDIIYQSFYHKHGMN